jgi:hypothetical protein
MKGEFIKDGNRFILKLPYEIEDNIEYVFCEDTPYAIDIIEIRADGEKLFFIEDIRDIESRTYFDIQKTIKGKNIYYILMIWDQRSAVRTYSISGKVLIWNDGRGIFQKINPDHSTNSYELLSNIKRLEIKYRILLPYPSLSLDDLREKTYISNFTKEYTIVVDSKWTLRLSILSFLQRFIRSVNKFK